MKNKHLAKKRSKRFARALGACRRCARLVALKMVIADRPGVMKSLCPSCGRELLATREMLNEGDGVLIRRYAACLNKSDDYYCPHAFTVLLDGSVEREDPPCSCGRERAVLNMFSEI